MSKKLIQAVEASDFKKVKRYLFEGADANLVDPNTGESLIGIAIYGRHGDIFDLLISYGARIEAKTDDAKNALIWACAEGRSDDVETLLKAGTGPNIHTIWGTPLIAAAEQGNRHIVELLLRYGAQINIVSELSVKSTALVAAVSSADLGLVRFLIEQGAAVDAAGDELGCMTPLMEACSDGNYDAAEVLLKAGARPDLKREFFGTALHVAARRGHLDLIKLLRSRGADIRAKGHTGETVLMSAAKHGHAEALKLIIDALKNEPMTEEEKDYCEKGWYDDYDEDERDALLWAAIYGRLEIVKILCQDGDSIDYHDKWGRSPLRYACMRGHENAATYLLESGARFADHMCGIDRPLAKRDSIVIDDMSLRLSELKRPFDEPDEFMWSCFWGYHDLAQLFLEKGANANSWDSHGRTPLMLASGASCLIYASTWKGPEEKYDVMPDREGRERIVQLLISSQADLNAVDSYGMTALMWASSRGIANVVEMLLIAGSDPEIIDKRGNTALDWATVEGHAEVVEFLKTPRPKSERTTEQNALDSAQESVSVRMEDSLERNEGPFPLLYHYRLLETQLSYGASCKIP